MKTLRKLSFDLDKSFILNYFNCNLSIYNIKNSLDEDYQQTYKKLANDFCVFFNDKFKSKGKLSIKTKADYNLDRVWHETFDFVYEIDGFTFPIIGNDFDKNYFLYREKMWVGNSYKGLWNEDNRTDRESYSYEECGFENKFDLQLEHTNFLMDYVKSKYKKELDLMFEELAVINETKEIVKQIKL